MVEQIALPSGATGYIFRTECANEGWSYIGQSSRLDQAHVEGYFGSGASITDAIAQHGAAGLRKTFLAAATSALELDYLEMLHIAEARKNGSRLLNGDFGGPRPFPLLQRALWFVAPEVMEAASDPKKFHRALVEHHDMVKQAILDVRSAPADDFYAGLERDLLVTQDLTYDCPTCGSPAGAVCRTNARSDILTRNPSRNHSKRPRAAG